MNLDWIVYGAALARALGWQSGDFIGMNDSSALNVCIEVKFG